MIFILNIKNIIYTCNNHLNFGNYLWAASGYPLGFDYSTLQMAGHANSLINSKSNGYKSQWDSADDQKSIIKGANILAETALERY
ncbi:polymorphic toxin type 44 domain-containing protein [Chryseobacterium arthrosphaerae]|uniref:polymorphic toxin type 44 domain-containing protein n=1 Tax=Chryseobacterium arthrosphaerae TaxID=651561 RepID=UPI0023E162FD|nr:polymorphic toxin type 44 domain-containing protein [Chryseobacterium arthrosphaerae]WES98782.1 polymorphic toxin type 44 domain-containing protein [Chryseobacterium arthrosphaerae]